MLHRLSLLLALSIGCVSDGADPVDPGPGPGPVGSPGASAVAGDPSLNRSVLSSRDEELVRVDPNAGGHQTLITFDDYVDVESLAVVGQVAYLGAEDNSIKAVDLASRQLLWETPLGRWETSSLAEPDVAVRDGAIYATGIPGVLAARGLANAEVRWDYAMSPSGNTDGYYAQVGKATVTADRVFIGTHSSLDQNYLHAIDRATGARLWRIELPDSLSGVIKVVGETLLVPAGDLYALDPATGAERWRVAMEPLSRGAGTPSIAGDAILVQGASAVVDGRLYCIELATGAMRWSIDAGNDYAGNYAPLVVNGVVFGVSERGSSQWPSGNGIPFLADIATGQLIWSNPDVSVETSPVFANGRLFFHGQNLRGTGDIDNNVGLIMLDATTGRFAGIDNYFRYSSSVTPIVVADNGIFTSAR